MKETHYPAPGNKVEAAVNFSPTTSGLLICKGQNELGIHNTTAIIRVSGKYTKFVLGFILILYGTMGVVLPSKAYDKVWNIKKHKSYGRRFRAWSGVRAAEGTSKYFEIDVGVHQGPAPSSLLIILVMQGSHRNVADICGSNHMQITQC